MHVKTHQIFFAALFTILLPVFADSDEPQSHQIPEKPMVVIIPSYNNLHYYQKNIDSVINQKYSNYRVIYIDDASNDGMSDEIPHYIKEHDAARRWTYIRNHVNRGAMSNLYHAIHACADHEIIISLDGDDWFKHDRVLARVNQEYQDESVWLTYGQFEWLSSGEKGFCEPLPDCVRQDVRRVRRCCGAATALRTFYAGLFKKIKREDLMYEGRFFPVAWDRAIMAPMLEMASPYHFNFIDEILYVYNDNHGCNDHALRYDLQGQLAALVFSMPNYEPLDKQN